MARPNFWKIRMVRNCRGFKAGDVVDVPNQVHPEYATRWEATGYAEPYSETATAENKMVKRPKASKVVHAV